MPDSNATPRAADSPAPDFAAYDRLTRDQSRREDELRAANRTALFDALSETPIHTVTVIFDGSGDSGQIESVEAWAPEAQAPGGQRLVDLPATIIPYFAPVWDSAEIDTRQVTIREVIEALCYAFLEKTHDGWENGDGAYGEFIFDVENRAIALEHNERVMTSQYHVHDF
jgi:hypothetical protein